MTEMNANAPKSRHIRGAQVYLASAAALAYRNNAVTDLSLGQGVEFFSFLRNMTADGFFTSEIGIKYLGYIGSAYLKEFPGCPPVPGLS